MTTVFDQALAPGARNAIRVCLNVQPHERVTVIADRECADIAASLVHEIEAVGAPYKAFILEDVAPRPLTDLPDCVNSRKMRHGHKVNINRQMMIQGMRADFHKVDRLSQKVIDIVHTAKEVRATTRGGSRFVATLNPDYKWIKTSGLISPDK